MDDCSVEITAAAAAAATAIGQPPSWYHKRLKAFLLLENHPKPDDYTATQVLRGLEGSLRTSSDKWVSGFLSPEHGLSFLVQFITCRLFATSLTKEQEQRLGPVGEGVHLCLLCLKAIMERPFGFEQAVKSFEADQATPLTPSSSFSPALNAIALCFAHPNVVLRVKSLALDLLAATCLMSGGGHHHLVLAAFEHVQLALGEERRFQTLVHCLSSFGRFDARLSVACLQFINILVNASSTQNLSLRVRLQREFRQLGLDEALQERMSGGGCSDALQGHIQAYLGDRVDYLLARCEQEVAQTRATLSKKQNAWTEVDKKRKRTANTSKPSLEKEARELYCQSLEAQAAYLTALARLKRVEQAIEQAS